MPHSHRTLLAARQHQGSVLILLVLLLPVLFILSSYAINIAYIEAVHADVQITTDVAVQAAGRAYIQTGSESAALAAARTAAERNRISGKRVPITAGDLEFGRSMRTSLATGYAFTPVSGDQEGNAVRITTNTLHQSENPLFRPVFPTMGVNVKIRPLQTAVSTQSTMDVALVIDRSGSMAFASDEMTDGYAPPAAAPAGWWYGDPAPPQSRWLDLVAAVTAFNAHLNSSPQQEKLSLSTYADTASTEQQLTTNYAQVLSGLNDYSLNFGGGSTAIGVGLQEALSTINNPVTSRPFAVKVMIMMTDGIHNTGASPESVKSALQASGVTLFTITFSNEADQGRMAALAESCGGEHFHAVDAAGLKTAFRSIARRLPSLMTQ